MKPVISIAEAQALIASYAGPPEGFRLLVSDELQDPIGINMAIISDSILKRGWGPDGFTQEKGFRIYEYKKFGASRITAQPDTKRKRPGREGSGVPMVVRSAR